MFNKSRYLSIKYILSLVRFSKKIPSHIKIINSTYLGIDSNPLPLKIIKGKNPLQRTIILYPGASPFAEEHPSMIFLGSVLANIGFTVFIPRIPLLKDLDISNSNVKWFKKAYEEIISFDEVKNTKVTCIGVSFGGALLLKSSINGIMKSFPPHCLVTYGTFFDIFTSLDFIISGKINIKGKEVSIKPHEWGVVVCLHNFLSDVDVGYDTSDLQKILKLRVQDKIDEVEIKVQKLDKSKKILMNQILDGKVSKEVKRILNIIFDKNMDTLKGMSPKQWHNQIQSKVFIMHGANDDMVPYTQSIKLSDSISDSELFISYLYEHNEISPKHSPMHKIKEMARLTSYFNSFIKYHEH